MAIAAGENCSGRKEFAPWIDRHALDYYQVDLGKCGLTDGATIRKRVEDAGGTIVNHCYKTPISIAACLHWLSTCPSAVIFEDCVEVSVHRRCLRANLKCDPTSLGSCLQDSPLRNDLVEQRVQAESDGYIRPPEGTGFGISLNEEVVKSLLVEESGW
eukprot:SAG31_NODE_1985_length_6715_cov_6.562924_4_plen_158_part_00